jgi:hypothetical protein
MARRRKAQHPLGDPAPGWEYAYEATFNGRRVEYRSPVKLHGRRGDHKFLRVVTNPAGSTWLDALSPDGQFVSVRLDAVKTVRNVRTVRKTVSRKERLRERRKEAA